MDDMIYYAHSMKIYNTAKEKFETSLIKSRFPDMHVLCPNKDLGELGGIEPYLKRVRQAKMVVCSTYKGYVGRGVYEEVKTALDSKIPVFVIKGKIIKEIVPVKGIKICNKRDWKVRYGKIVL